MNPLKNCPYKTYAQMETAIKTAGSKMELATKHEVGTRTINRWMQNLRLTAHDSNFRDLIIADTHFPYARKDWFEYVSAMKAKHNLNRLIHLGDLVDHHTISRHQASPDALSTIGEYQLALSQVQQLIELFPEAILVVGNHDDRVFRQAGTVGISSMMVKPIHDLYKLPDTWQVCKNGFLKTKHGNSVILHGNDFSGPGAADKWRTKLQSSVIMGHVHTAANVRFYATPSSFQFSAICPCLADEKSIAMQYAQAYGGLFTNGCIISTKEVFLIDIMNGRQQ